MSRLSVIADYRRALKENYKLSEGDCNKACEKCKDFYDEAYFEDDTSGDTFDDLNESLEKAGFKDSVKMTEDFLGLIGKEKLR